MRVRRWTLVRQICAILLLTCLLSFLTSLAVMQSLQSEHLHALYARSLDLISFDVHTLEQEIEHVQQLAYTIVTMDAIQSECSAYLDAVDASAGISAQNRNLDAIATLISPVLQESSAIACANLIDNRGTVRVQAARSFLRLDEDEADMLDRMGREAQGATLLASLPSRPEWIFVVKQLREKRNLSMRHVGVVVLCVDMHRLQAFLPSEPSGAYLLSLSTTGTTYQLGQNLEGMPPEETLAGHFDGEKGYALIQASDRTFFAVRIPGSHLTATVVTPYNDMFLHQYRVFMRYMGMLALFSFLAFLLALFLTRRTTGELQRMIAHMKQIHGDEPDTIPLLTDITHSNRDMRDLTDAFNNMARRVNALVDENYRHALWQTRTQLALLQAQINPHFLYNTLNTIYWEAKESGQAPIASMTEALSHLLREAVDVHETLVTVDKELEILRYFVLIEKTRYRDRLQLSFDVSDHVSDLAIPKFSLQVLLENAIHHGADQMLTPCQISVALYVSDGICHCVVENTGPAPESDLMDKLRRGEKHGEGSGIGLLNMEKRAKALLGEKSCLQLYRNEKREVTVAHLSFPAMPCPMRHEEGGIAHEL